MTTVTGIVIPTDMQQPLVIRDLSPADGDAYKGIFDSSFQVVLLDRPESSMYINENGKHDSLPFNPRATAILWSHNSAFRGADLLAGDVLIVGPVGPDGTDLSVPDDLVDLLLGRGPFKVEVQVDNESGWHGNDKRFDEVHVAYFDAVNLARRWTKVREVRVVMDYSAHIDQWLQIGQRSRHLENAGDPPFTRESFARCSTLDELEDRISSGNWSLGTAFYYRDLCLINQVDGGDEWLTIRSFTDEDGETTSIAFETFIFGPFIERGEFATIIRRLLAASRDQCERLQY
jgi:hypothetical protein